MFVCYIVVDVRREQQNMYGKLSLIFSYFWNVVLDEMLLEALPYSKSERK